MHRTDQNTGSYRLPAPIQPLSVQAFTASNAFGAGISATLQGLSSGVSALNNHGFPGLDIDTYIGRIDGIEGHKLPAHLQDFDARNNKIMDLALDQDNFRTKVMEAKRKYGADRIGVILGTSTSGILETENAYRRRDPSSGCLPQDFRYQERQNTSAPAAFVQALLGITGPAWVISTACSSSSKVFATAQRLLDAGWCDAVIVGGADSLCLTTLYGFHALELIDQTPCKPMDRERNGISIGEAAGFMLLTRFESQNSELVLSGYGESSDAYHMSSPHPEGLGAARAMTECLARANTGANTIDFALLHGTGTPANDKAEDKALTTLFGNHLPCASIKGAIGHTLGASGIMNAVVACLSLTQNLLPGTANLKEIDPAFSSNVLFGPKPFSARRIITHAFGFGGSNAVLIFDRR
jgi:3-oxoacyl-[acyl-carrier-protein] synthase I